MNKVVNHEPSNIKEGTCSFWEVNDKGKISFNSRKTLGFLKLYGWGFFQAHPNRTVKKELFINDNGILRINNEETAKKKVMNFLVNTDEKEFVEGVFKHPTDNVIKEEVLNQWINMSEGQWKKILQSLDVYSEESYEETTDINLFRDDKDSAHIRFKNGVVKITSNNIKLMKQNEMSEKGAIWESEQQKHSISIVEEDRMGSFEQFVTNAFKKLNPKSDDVDWRKNYKLDEEQYSSFRHAYGYILHGYKSMDELKCIICYDSEGTFDKPTGGNGKSLTMGSIKYYKKVSSLDGKQVHKGDKFIWSGVTAETKFVLINDIEKDLKFQSLFSVITDDFQTEGKGANKVIIPKEKSPKIAITSNGLISGKGTSHARRKHELVFGNYWKRCEDEGENVSDLKHIGKTLFSSPEFTSDDWDDFYNYGFSCIQEYLQDGLINITSDNLEIRSKIIEIEGSEGTGEIVEWMDNWIRVTRLEGLYYKDTGISEEDLYNAFCRDNPRLQPHFPNGWNLSKFSDLFFTFIKLTDGYYYNDHKSNLGNTKTSRRWLRGVSPQKPHILITADTDSTVSPLLTNDNNPVVQNIDDEEDLKKYF